MHSFVLTVLIAVAAKLQPSVQCDFSAQVTLAEEDQQPAPSQQPETTAKNKPQQSVLEVKAGEEAVKNTDLYQKTGYWHPFTRMPRFILRDQKNIWTSPFHTTNRDAKWWVIFGGATGALIATDKYVSRNLPTHSTLSTVGNDASYLGQSYALLPIATGFYFIGTATGSDHFREAGLLSFETVADVSLISLAMKSITNRERPLERAGNGEFEASAGARYSSSFPSGHAIATFAMASILTHEYPHKLWLKILVYSYAGGVLGARLAANQHFPGDVLAGAAIGWFTGDYVYGKRHNQDLDRKPGMAKAILSHLETGGSFH
jgi:membrane-associated phospholipid phosphatase